jgi:hypothetical protein
VLLPGEAPQHLDIVRALLVAREHQEGRVVIALRCLVQQKSRVLQEARGREITAPSPEPARAVEPIGEIALGQRQPLRGVQRLGPGELKAPAVVEQDAFIDDIAEEVLANADLVIDEFNPVHDKRHGRLARGLTRAPLEIAPQRQILGLLLGLNNKY